VDKEGSDTESAEDTTGKDEADKTTGEEPKKDDKKPSSGVVARVSTLFAAVKNSVKKPKESKYSETPESEMKLHDNEEKKDAENDNVVYADIDKSALDSGTRKETVESEKTEYAEIKPQK
jgi:mRNA deadenylase 3'-5' endonuclease subunit Ccr4